MGSLFQKLFLYVTFDFNFYYKHKTYVLGNTFQAGLLDLAHMYVLAERIW